MFKRHLAFSEASDRQHHSKVLYLNLFKRTTTCVVAKPLVMIILLSNIFKHNNEKCLIFYERVSMNEIILKV